MSHSADELKTLYDKAIANLIKLHRKETMKAVLNLNSKTSSGFSVGDLNADSFIEEHGESISEMDADECVAFVKMLTSMDE